MVFLQYILKQEKSSMIYQVLKVTLDNPTKINFGTPCKDYLSVLDIELPFEEMIKITEWRLKKWMKKKTEKDASMYSLSEKQKQHKISIIENEELKIQEYLSSGCCNVKLVKLIFKSKSQTKRKWKYADNLCTGCKLMEETGQEILGGGP